jgi:hypothetical protein
MTRARTVVVTLALLALAGCGGGASYENADPAVVRQVESSSSCSDLQSIANAWNARFEAYPEGSARDEARETFLVASDRLIDLGCPGW